MKATFYCDESGSTGANWLDSAQPFFVYGGWLIPDKSRDAILSDLADIFKKYPGTEIKSSRFFKMGKANEYFKRLFDLMLHTAAFPIFTITDKSYIVAPKIIETFFDPAYNQTLTNEITWDVELKKQLAGVIRKNSVVSDFAKLIHSGTLTLDEMRSINATLIQAFSGIPNVVISLEQITDDGFREMLDEFNKPSSSRSLTIPSLNHLMQVLQKFSENYNFEAVVVHDNIRGYEKGFDMIKDIFLSQGEVHVLQGTDFQWYSKLPNITELTLMDSKDVMLIQVADLLCGFLFRCFKKIDKNIALVDVEKEIMKHLFVLHNEMRTWDYVFPESLVVKYLNAIECSVADPPPTENNVLDSSIAKYIKK